MNAVDLFIVLVILTQNRYKLTEQKGSVNLRDYALILRLRFASERPYTLSSSPADSFLKFPKCLNQDRGIVLKRIRESIDIKGIETAQKTQNFLAPAA
jgi:hypothetical protein